MFEASNEEIIIIPQKTANLEMNYNTSDENTRNFDYLDAPRNPFNNNTELNSSLYFEDGIRSVDFVLVWKFSEEESPEIEAERNAKREVFEENLMNEGLEIERETVDGEFNFIKVSCTKIKNKNKNRNDNYVNNCLFFRFMLLSRFCVDIVKF